jgi:hypothetical protein
MNVTVTVTPTSMRQHQATVLYRCVRELMFLRPRIERHFHYPEVLATIKSADPHARYLVCIPLCTCDVVYYFLCGADQAWTFGTCGYRIWVAASAPTPGESLLMGGSKRRWSLSMLSPTSGSYSFERSHRDRALTCIDR